MAIKATLCSLNRKYTVLNSLLFEAFYCLLLLTQVFTKASVLNSIEL